jgi:hypothetical protein
MLSNNAPPLNGIGLQRASSERSASRWLSWMGPWTYDLFVAQADSPMHEYLVGTRLAMHPTWWLELAFSRTAQWGGTGRPQSIESFLRMLVGLGVNANTLQERAQDPANELAGYDVRLRCPRSVRCAFYVQLTGEDATHGLPASFLGLYGGETWSADGRHRWFAEFAESLCSAPFEYHTRRLCAYRNSEYPAGYTHATRWLGDAAGADSRVWTIGWLDAERGTSIRLHGGTIGARIGVFGIPDDPVHSGPLKGISARQSWDWRTSTFEAELDWTHIAAPLGTHVEARAGLTWQLRF